MPTGEIRVDTLFEDAPDGGRLMFHIDADEGDHPLEKKAWIWGKPVRVLP